MGVILCSVHLLAQQELENWLQYWRHHLDILQVQESAVFENLYALGIDPRQLSEYDVSESALAVMLTAKEKEAKRSADIALNQRHELYSVCNDRPNGNSACFKDASYSASNQQRRRNTPKEVQWEEYVVEEDSENKLPGFTEKAFNDDIVKLYNSDNSLYPPLAFERYPASFRLVTPEPVINAYYHAR